MYRNRLWTERTQCSDQSGTKKRSSAAKSEAAASSASHRPGPRRRAADASEPSTSPGWRRGPPIGERPNRPSMLVVREWDSRRRHRARKGRRCGARCRRSAGVRGPSTRSSPPPAGDAAGRGCRERYRAPVYRRASAPRRVGDGCRSGRCPRSSHPRRRCTRTGARRAGRV